jgi:hypothetical protein
MFERHILPFFSEISQFNFCDGQEGFTAKASIFEVPFEISPTIGRHNFETCQDCQNYIAKVTIDLNEYYTGKRNTRAFPNCCKQHKNLVKLKLFNKADYDKVPEMTAKKIIYAYQHIINNYDSENWYSEITDYLEWVEMSFGKMPDGFGCSLLINRYVAGIENLIKSNKQIPEEKKESILKYLANKPSKENNVIKSIHILIDIYNRWYKIFPFELESYFGNLRAQFANRIPIVKGEPKTNKYSGLSSAKMHTEDSLFEELIKLTDLLLTKINGIELHEKGLISDSNKLKLELLIQDRKLKLKAGYINQSPKAELRYRRMIKDWFNDEKKFMNELTPILKEQQEYPELARREKINSELKKHRFSDLEKVGKLSKKGQDELINLLTSKDIAFVVAMFDFLGYFTFLEKEFYTSKEKTNKIVSSWFNSDIDGRAIKGNRNVLIPNSKENKASYQAHLHKEEVEKQYLQLK